MENTKRLYRNTSNKVIAGVCSGLGNYFNIDPVIVRIIFLILLFVGGGGFIIYLILAIAVPSGNAVSKENISNNDKKVEDVAHEVVNEDEEKKKYRNQTAIGITAILVGLLIFFGNFIQYINPRHFWPILLIVIGIGLIISANSWFKNNKNKVDNKIDDIIETKEETSYTEDENK